MSSDSGLFPALYENMTLSIRLEVHDVSHCLATGNMYRKFSEIWSVVFEIRKRIDKQTNKQTNIHTYRHADHNTLRFYWGEVIT